MRSGLPAGGKSARAVPVNHGNAPRAGTQKPITRPPEELHQRPLTGSWRWVIATDRVHASVETSKLLGLQGEADWSAGAALEWLPAEHRQGMIRAVLSALRSRPSKPFAFSLGSAGDLRRISLRTRVDFGASGEPVAVSGLWQEVTENRSVKGPNSWRARHDLLTGLHNREMLFAQAPSIIAHAESTGKFVAVVLWDIDKLGNVNSSMGHAAGDAVLREAAARLRKSLSGNGCLARFGSDEFIVVDAFETEESLMQEIERLKTEMFSTLAVAGYAPELSVSAGVAILDHRTNAIEDAITNAGVALAHAKEKGANTISLFTQRMREQVEGYRAQLALARRALALDMIEPFYQPKVALDDGSIIGFEALLRLNDGKTIRMPGEIAAAFEDRGTAGAIGDRMLNLVLAQIRRWSIDRVAFGNVALNVSGVELREPDFAQRVLDALERHGVAPGRLSLEMTESALIGQHGACIAEQLNVLRRAGLQTSLDDFGTGYASLTHFKSLPITALKIDRSFIGNLCTDSQDVAIVAGLVQISKALGLLVVAEGVETLAQAALLRELRCDAMQGHLVSAPVSAAAATSWLASWRLGQEKSRLSEPSTSQLH